MTAASFAVSSGLKSGEPALLLCLPFTCLSVLPAGLQGICSALRSSLRFPLHTT